jgi:methyl-accepting chemotaxis protein
MRALRSRLSDESGLAERILVGIVAWAFASVACLVTILITANHIDERVAFIRSQVTPIDHNLETVKVLEQVNQHADDINTAAAPLSGQLNQVTDHTKSIMSEAAAIDDTAKSINSSVQSIDGNVSDIHGSVLSINSLAHSIDGTVRDINANAASINGTVHTINDSFGSVVNLVYSIRGDKNATGLGDGLAGSNRRLDVLLGLVTGIKGDTGNVLALVGSIQASARSIDGKTPNTP